jgi:hypothetical protein
MERDRKEEIESKDRCRDIGGEMEGGDAGKQTEGKKQQERAEEERQERRERRPKIMWRDIGRELEGD